jgi:predicted O-methyltransferase YrrM
MVGFNRIFYYIIHFISARNTRGFGVHSPSLFKFTRYVLLEKHSFYAFQSIERIRTELLNANTMVLEVKDFGTGNDRNETVSSVAKHSLGSPKYGQLLFRMVHYFKPHYVLELGTSLGIATSYLASPSSKTNCVSLEGCPQIAAVARENFKKLGLENIEVVVGNIDSTIGAVLNKIDRLDFVFMDANHKSEAVLNYFELCMKKIHDDSVVVIDDINWSDDMKVAWEMVKKHEMVKSTIDLFQLGIVFFNPNIPKKHYKMRY